MPILGQLDLEPGMFIRTAVMLAGLACVYYAVRLMRRRWRIRRDPVRAFGKVVSLELQRGGEGPDWYEPMVRYRDETGATHEGRLMIVRDTEAYAVGKQVPIVYERGNPTNLIDPSDGWTERIAITLVLGAGIVLFAFGAAAEVVMH